MMTKDRPGIIGLSLGRGSTLDTLAALSKDYSNKRLSGYFPFFSSIGSNKFVFSTKAQSHYNTQSGRKYFQHPPGARDLGRGTPPHCCTSPLHRCSPGFSTLCCSPLSCQPKHEVKLHFIKYLQYPPCTDSQHLHPAEPSLHPRRRRSLPPRCWEPQWRYHSR